MSQENVHAACSQIFEDSRHLNVSESMETPEPQSPQEYFHVARSQLKEQDTILNGNMSRQQSIKSKIRRKPRASTKGDHLKMEIKALRLNLKDAKANEANLKTKVKIYKNQLLTLWHERRENISKLEVREDRIGQLKDETIRQEASFQSEVETLRLKLEDSKANEANLTQQVSKYHSLELEVEYLKTENSKLQMLVGETRDINEDVLLFSNPLPTGQSVEEKNTAYAENLEEEKLVLREETEEQTYKAETEPLNVELQNLKDTERDIESHLDKCQTEVEQLKGEMQWLEDNRKTLSEGNQNLLDSVNHLVKYQEEVEELKWELQSLEDDRKTLSEVNQKLAAKVSSLESQVSTKQAELNTLRAALCNHEVRQVKLDEDKLQRLSELEHLKEKTQVENEYLVAEVSRMQESLQSKERELHCALEDLREKKTSTNEITEIKKELNRVSNLLSDEKKTLKERDTYIRSLEEEKLALTQYQRNNIDEIAHQQSINQNLRKEVEELKCRLKNMNDELANQESNDEDHEDSLKNQLREAQEVNKNNELTLEKRDALITTLQENNLFLNEESKGMNGELERLKDQVYFLEGKLEVAQSFLKDYNKTTEDLECAENCNKTNQAEIKNLKQALSDLQKERELLKDNNNISESERDQLESLSSGQKDEIKRLMSTLKDYQYQLEDADQSVREIKRVAANQQREIDAKQHIIDELYTHNTDLKQRIHDFEKQSETRQEEEYLVDRDNLAEELRKAGEFRLGSPQETPADESQPTSVLSRWGKGVLKAGVCVASAAALISMGFLSGGMYTHCNSNPYCDMFDWTFTLMQPFLNVNNSGRPF